MSQRNVERIIGRLVLDVSFRRRFAADAERALLDVARCGLELTGGEIRALVLVDPKLAEGLAGSIALPLQEDDVKGGIA